MDLRSRDLHLRADLLAAGFTDGELLRLRRAGTVTSVRRGAYVYGDDERLRDSDARHALRVVSTLPRLAPGAVVSHVSAAVLHGLPVWNLPLRRVHVTRDARAGGRVTDSLHVHVAPLEASEVVQVGGSTVTSVARTVVDLARSAPFEEAVVIADGALHAGLIDPAALLAAQVRSARWPGGPGALRVVEFADGLADNPGESRSRVGMWRAGLPSPVLQWIVWTRDGEYVGRVDFAWPKLRTVGEFDGKVKYGRLLKPGQTVGDVVYAEKLREDAVRAEGLGMVRWGWDALDEFGLVAARFRRTFASG